MYVTQIPTSAHNLYKTLWIYVQRYIQIYTYTHNHTYIYMYIYTILLIQRSVNICAPLRFFIFEFILQCFVILIQAEPNIFWYILCSSWICVTKDAGSGYTCWPWSPSLGDHQANTCNVMSTLVKSDEAMDEPSRCQSITLRYHALPQQVWNTKKWKRPREPRSQHCHALSWCNLSCLEEQHHKHGKCTEIKLWCSKTSLDACDLANGKANFWPPSCWSCRVVTNCFNIKQARKTLQHISEWNIAINKCDRLGFAAEKHRPQK